jgi:hypothetical protein
MQEFAQRLFARPPHFASGGPVDREGRSGLSHGLLLHKISQRALIMETIPAFVNLIFLDAGIGSVFIHRHYERPFPSFPLKIYQNIEKVEQIWSLDDFQGDGGFLASWGDGTSTAR